MGKYLDQIVTFLLTYLAQGDHMKVLIAFTLGAIVSGLFSVYVLPKIWKPKV